jgi:cell wall-associated NlpC family hydrolase
MPARTPRFTWRPVATLPALALTVAVAFAVPAGTAQASVRTTAVSFGVGVGAPSVVRSEPVSSRTGLALVASAQAGRAAVAAPSRAVLVMRMAAALSGRPYLYGAAGPSSFDCSGFTRYVFGRAVGRVLPHNAAAQYALSHKIAKSAIRPGDLVFFVSNGYVYHVGIYAGHGLIWHAPYPGDHVRLARIFTSSWVAGRVL